MAPRKSSVGQTVKSPEKPPAKKQKTAEKSNSRHDIRPSNVPNQPARSIAVPQDTITHLEHPAVVLNPHRAIESLGGSEAVSRFVNDESATKSIAFSPHPGHPFRGSISSQRVSRSSGLLIKVTGPKATGRRRRKGSNEPFAQIQSPASTANAAESLGRVRRLLTDRPRACTVEALGSINDTHRFRSLPDLQFSVADTSLAQSLLSIVQGYDFQKIKDFQLGARPAATASAPIFPPPSFLGSAFPTLYNYEQNNAVRTDMNPVTGERKTVSSQTSHPNLLITISAVAEQVPDRPPAGVDPLVKLSKRVQICIKRMTKVFANQRPVVSRRVLHKLLPNDNATEVRLAIQYCAYTFLDGPWRDCLVRYGVDPRSDPKYSMYQTISFQMLKTDNSGSSRRVQYRRRPDKASDSHLFDGKTLPDDARVWQLCDISDRLLAKILNAPTNEAYEALFCGWVQNGVLAKVRSIMRNKLQTLKDGERPNDAIYARFLSFPDSVETFAAVDACALDLPSKLEMELQNDYRTLARKALRTANAALVDEADGDHNEVDNEVDDELMNDDDEADEANEVMGDDEPENAGVEE